MCSARSDRILTQTSDISVRRRADELVAFVANVLKDRVSNVKVGAGLPCSAVQCSASQQRGLWLIFAFLAKATKRLTSTPAIVVDHQSAAGAFGAASPISLFSPSHASLCASSAQDDEVRGPEGFARAAEAKGTPAWLLSSARVRARGAEFSAACLLPARPADGDQSSA